MSSVIVDVKVDDLVESAVARMYDGGTWVSAIDELAVLQLKYPQLFLSRDARKIQAEFWVRVSEDAGRKFRKTSSARRLIFQTRRKLKHYTCLHAQATTSEEHPGWLLDIRPIPVPVPGTRQTDEVTKFGHMYVRAFVEVTRPVNL